MYLRRAQSYRFVRQVLEDTFGKDELTKIYRLTATGPVEMNLADELDQMERLFSGAYVIACREIGMKERTLQRPRCRPIRQRARCDIPPLGRLPLLRSRPRRRLPHDGPRPSSTASGRRPKSG